MLRLGKVTLTDSGLQQLSRMTSLRWLALDAKVDARWLSQELPECRIAVWDSENGDRTGEGRLNGTKQ